GGGGITRTARAAGGRIWQGVRSGSGRLRAVAASTAVAGRAVAGSLVRSAGQIAIRTIVPGEFLDAAAVATAMAPQVGVRGVAILASAEVASVATATTVGTAATAAVGWAYTDIRRSINNERTLTDDAIDTWRQYGLFGTFRELAREVRDAF